MPYELTCLDCGSQGHVVKRSDAKYCPICITRRALKYVESGRHGFRSTRKCRTCTRTFRMTHAKDFKTCGHCDTESLDAVTLITLPRCSRCGGAVSPRSALPAVCLGCQSDPRERTWLLKALTNGHRSRSTANAALLRDIASGSPHLRRIEPT